MGSERTSFSIEVLPAKVCSCFFFFSSISSDFSRNLLLVRFLWRNLCFCLWSPAETRSLFVATFVLFRVAISGENVISAGYLNSASNVLRALCDVYFFSRSCVVLAENLEYAGSVSFRLTVLTRKGKRLSCMGRPRVLSRSSGCLSR